MKTILCWLLIFGATAQAHAARAAKELDWFDLGAANSQLPNPNPKMSGSTLERWYSAKSRRAFGRPGTLRFAGLVKIVSIEEKNGEWTVVAERGFTEAQRRRKELRELFPNDSSHSSYGGKLAEQTFGGPSSGDGKLTPHRKCVVTWKTDQKPGLPVGKQSTIAGSIVDANWTTSVVTVSLEVDPKP